MNTLTKSFAKRALSMLLVVIMVFSLGIVGITSASAANVELAPTSYTHGENAYLYFIKPSNWTNVSMLIGHNSYSEMRSFTKLTGNLYYLKMVKWEGWTQWAIVDATGWSSSNEMVSGRIANLTNKTDINTSYEFGADKTYLIKTTTSNTTYYSNGYEGLDSVQYAYAQLSTDGGATGTTNSATGTVSITTTEMTGNGKVSAATGTNSATAANSASVTMTATAKSGYNFLGWYNTSGTKVSSSSSFTYTCSGSTATYYARFEKSVSITNATATKGTEAVVGSPSTIKYTYDVSGTSTEPEIKLLLNGTEFGGDYTVDKDSKIITFTPTVANKNYLFSVQISVDGVTETTDGVSYNIRDVFDASLSADTESIFVGDGNFTLTVTDNSDQYSAATYTLETIGGVVVEDNNTTGVFTLPADVVGMTTYRVTVTLSGEFSGVTKKTNTVSLTVLPKEFTVNLSAPKSTKEDYPFTITATYAFAPEGEMLFTLVGSDGKTYENTNGVFDNVIADCPESAESTTVTYTVTLTVTAADGTETSVTDTATVTITKDLGVYPVKIYFKCSDTYGYLPNAKVNGEAVELTKVTAIETLPSTPNASDTATYSWYCYTSGEDIDYGQEVLFAVNANRVYFYNASLSIKAGQGDYEMDGNYYCYYLALENLNGGSNTLSNISKLSVDERNWTESAVNMIYDVDTDALAEVALNYRYANYGDANCDGDINIKDATYIQKSLAKMVDPSTLSTTVSDVNGDGSVTIKDATAIQKQLAGL